MFYLANSLGLGNTMCFPIEITPAEKSILVSRENGFLGRKPFGPPNRPF